MPNRTRTIGKVVYSIIACIINSLFIAAMSQIAIPLPFASVPITMQTFAVGITGSNLGPYLGPLSIMMYLVEGISGLPFFALQKSGVRIMLGPSGGFLIGFIPAACVAGLLSSKTGRDRNILWNGLYITLSTSIILVFGVTWMLVLGMGTVAFTKGLLPFIPGDLVKVILATFCIPLQWVSMHWIGRKIVAMYTQTRK